MEGLSEEEYRRFMKLQDIYPEEDTWDLYEAAAPYLKSEQIFRRFLETLIEKELTHAREADDKEERKIKESLNFAFTSQLPNDRFSKPHQRNIKSTSKDNRSDIKNHPRKQRMSDEEVKTPVKRFGSFNELIKKKSGINLKTHENSDLSSKEPENLTESMIDYFFYQQKEKAKFPKNPDYSLHEYKETEGDEVDFFQYEIEIETELDDIMQQLLSQLPHLDTKYLESKAINFLFDPEGLRAFIHEEESKRDETRKTKLIRDETIEKTEPVCNPQRTENHDRPKKTWRIIIKKTITKSGEIYTKVNNSFMLATDGNFSWMSFSPFGATQLNFYIY